uniref:cell cycle checkpoint control protein RAD9B isoform X2 n=1 Tax=Monopterus albus TaxID=43700 RepID=UPI0009B45332|nr:cell cycle checkpoint control protein RAD9B isoform X2 [Monopterus albus]
MNCVLEGNCVKAFGRAIHALSRIGEELWLDPMVGGPAASLLVLQLALRSVNAAHSAYACFLFSQLFFQHYSLGSASEQGNETVKCKLVIKSLLPLFRCLTSIERNVERCQISISTPSDRVTIQFFCRHDAVLHIVNTWWQCAPNSPSAFVIGITKTHSFRFQESEALQAVFASHSCPNVLQAPARLLSDTVMHFPVSQEEITLSVTPLRLSLRNHYERGNVHMKIINTEISLPPDEFDAFQVGVDSDITFCLKELRGLLSFAESHCLPVSVHFGAAGKPVCFSVDNLVLKATVVLATLIDSESGGPSQSPETPAPTTPRCAGAAAPPVGSYDAGNSKPQDFPAVTELIASSQGSPIINPPALGQPCAAISASTMICSLLFRALSSEQEDAADDLPVLASRSDTEEEED